MPQDKSLDKFGINVLKNSREISQNVYRFKNLQITK